MDLYFSFSYTTLIALFAFILINKWKNSKTSKKLENLPPSPKKLPLIGHMHLVGSLPHRTFSDLAEKYGPLMLLKLGETSNVVVSSAELAKVVLKDQDPTFAARPKTLALEIISYNHSAISFSPYDDYWRQMRRICILELLSAKQVKSFGSIRHDEVLILVKSIRSAAGEGKPINLTQNIISTMSAITCRAAFGKVCRDKANFVKIMRKTLALSGGFDLTDLFPSSKILKNLSWNKVKLLAMRRKLDEILDGIIDEHKQNLAKDTKGNGEFGNEDLVDVFLRVKENGELQFPVHNDNIKGVISEIFSAGTESSSTTINWAMTELMRNPDVMQKAQAEVREAFNAQKSVETQNLKYLKLVIKETLRLHPALALIPRASRQECKVNGYVIPANSKVFINSWKIARDPKCWPNPERFEPERFENNPVDLMGNHFEYLPFGAGRRICPGLTFGLTGVELPLAQLLYNFDWKLPQGIHPNDLNMIENSGMTASRKEELYLVAVPYHSH